MRAVVLAVALLGWAGALSAQLPGVRRSRPASAAEAERRATGPRGPGADTTRRDTTTAGRGLGLPQRPSREFEPPDSVTAALLLRSGFRVTRYTADSVRFLAQEKEIRLAGHALVERDGSQLEADTVRYVQGTCDMEAAGSPKLFDRTGVVVGEGMHYDACNQVGIIGRATTEFREGSALWILRGNLAVDNDAERTYLAGSTITSCTVPDPHYHFAAGTVKRTRQIMVARPAVLYIADVPVLWLPFIFQDLRRGRRSGLIPPQFGINDIVRNSPSYHRHVANLGYYWAMSDYTDAQVTMDWYAQRFVAMNGRLRYRWLDRFISGGVSYQELRESGGSTSRRFSLAHSQDFSLTSRLSANLDYASSSRVISRNAVDPILAVATIDSRLNFSRRFAGGTLSFGGSRTQSLDKPQVTMSFPVLSFAPQPISLGEFVTWSPSFNFTNATLRNGPAAGLLYLSAGLPDTLLSNTRRTSFQIATPLRIGRWNWSNSFSVEDNRSNQRQTVTFPDPDDTTQTVRRTYVEAFSTSVDWATGINLPVVFQGTWNLQPRIDIANTGGGAFMVRNLHTGGRFVSQGKRLAYGASLAPTFFGLWGGIGPIARIRHSISPSLGWQYSPAATLPEDYARAISADGRTLNRTIEARQTLTLGLSQNFEAKLRPPPRPAGQDSATAPEPEGRKIKLLSVQSGGVSYDLEQAKRPGRTGWTTDAMSNTFSSDLLRGFSLSTNHRLWRGRVGYTGAKLAPTLTSVSMRFSLGPSTFRALGGLLGFVVAGGTPRGDSLADVGDSARAGVLGSNAFQRGPLSTRFSALDRMGERGAGAGLNASLSLDVQRDLDSLLQERSPSRRTLSGNVSFAPTRQWALSWQTQYNFTTGKFGEHVVRLDRSLHDWRATFSFVQSPNGNFLFNFNIQLNDQPDIKFEYDQRNIR